MKFEFWTVEDIKNAIRALEDHYTSGVASASYNAGGTITFINRANMRSTISDLYKVYYQKAEVEKTKPVYRSVVVSSKGLR